jgi:hypothetical protein
MRHKLSAWLLENVPNCYDHMHLFVREVVYGIGTAALLPSGLKVRF